MKTYNHTWGQIHLNVFNYKYKYLEEIKYKYNTNTLKYVFKYSQIQIHKYLTTCPLTAKGSVQLDNNMRIPLPICVEMEFSLQIFHR